MDKADIHIRNIVSKDARIDNRKLDEYREVSVEYDVAKSAEGSARVKIGETEVIAGVKMEVMEPYSDAPDKGSLMVGAELLPLSSPEFESGPPSIQAIELGRVVDRGIRESEAVDFKKLCIKEGEAAWMIIVDICSINDTGNLFDASALAALAAIKAAKYPTLDENNKIDYKKLTDESLPLSKLPIAITVHKIGDKLLIDPSTEEEKVSDSRLTITVMEDGTLCSLQKGGEKPFAVEDIDAMTKLAISKAEELRSKL